MIHLLDDNIAENPQSPCVRNCCLDQNDICVGCYRHLNEITGWQSMSVTCRANTLKLCQERKQAYEMKT